jgi:hypothetical protein
MPTDQVEPQLRACTMLPPPNSVMLLQHEWHQSYCIGTRWVKVAWTGASGVPRNFFGRGGYARNFFFVGGGVQQIELRTQGSENGD